MFLFFTLFELLFTAIKAVIYIIDHTLEPNVLEILSETVELSKQR